MTTPLALEQSLRALGGATERPFRENHTGRWVSADLEELRLLNCERTRQRGRDTTAPFVLLLCGNDDLPPLLDLNTPAALRSRLSFPLRLAPWTADLSAAYCAAQWQHVGVNVNPMDPQALGLLPTAAEGLPRTIHQIALNALLNALDQRQKIMTSQHVQTALDALPWIGKNIF